MSSYLDVVAVTQTTKLLLASSVPHIEPDGSTVSVEDKGVHLHTQCGYVLLLEFTSQVALDKCGFASATIADQDELEGGHVSFSGHFAIDYL